SDFFASTPRFTATSIDSSNFAVAVSLTSLSASSIGYALVRSTLVRTVFIRLDRCGETLLCAIAMSLHPFDRDAHAASAARYGADCGVHVGSSEIGLLELRNFLGLGAGELAYLVAMRLAAAFLDLRGLLDQHGRGRRLHHESEALVGVRGDQDRNRQSRLHALRLRVECLAELHDVQAALTERGSDRWARIRLTRGDLQLDEADDFLCHFVSPVGTSGRCAPSPNLTA